MTGQTHKNVQTANTAVSEVCHNQLYLERTEHVSNADIQYVATD